MRKESLTWYPGKNRAVSEPAAAPMTAPPASRSVNPVSAPPLVQFGQVPTTLVPLPFANHTVWKLASKRVSSTSVPGPGVPAQRVWSKKESSAGVGRSRRKGRPLSKSRTSPAANAALPS